MAAAGLLDHPELRTVLALWRTPERLARAAAWQQPGGGLVDMLVFGETAVIGMRRGAQQPLPAALPSAAPVRHGRRVRRGPDGREMAAAAAGTLMLRGPDGAAPRLGLGTERLSEP